MYFLDGPLAGLTNIKSNLLDIAYPKNLYCVCCGNIIDDTRSYSLCDHCMLHVSWDTEPAVQTAESLKMLRCTRYGIYERSMIFALKYDGHKYIANTIAEIMRDRIKLDKEWETENKNALLVPVPMHKNKKRARGFNHAELISKSLSELTGMDMLDALLRTKETRPMRGLGADERRRNISGTMEVKSYLKKWISGRKVILVDDFCTTGSTGSECAKALYEAGAEEVRLLVFAARVQKL